MWLSAAAVHSLRCIEQGGGLTYTTSIQRDWGIEKYLQLENRRLPYRGKWGISPHLRMRSTGLPNKACSRLRDFCKSLRKICKGRRGTTPGNALPPFPSKRNVALNKVRRQRRRKGPHFPSFSFAAAAVLAVLGSLTGHFGLLTPLSSFLT